ncbi:hypothetical protein [Bacillus pacificus]|uniref:hypothetical protein n=1 Tax=Bacillus pacificus TaxID=2026187 RepID=UPI003978115D
MPNLTNRLKLSLPNGNEYVNRTALNKIFEDIDRLVMLQGDFDVAKKEIDENLAKKLSKSGDTMTGDLKLERTGTAARDIQWSKDNVVQTNLGMNSANKLRLYDNVNALTAFEYDTVSKSFNVLSSTNLLKKTGDVMTGNLDIVAPAKGERGVFLKSPNLSVSLTNSDAGTNPSVNLYDSTNKEFIFHYSKDGGFDLKASKTNLVKKTGDTMTGPLKFNRDRGIAWNDGVKDIHSITTGGDNKTYFTDGVNGIDYAIYDPTTKSFNILQNTNLLKKSGDTMDGWLRFLNNQELQFQTKEGVSQAALAVDGDGNFFAWNSPGDKYLWFLNRKTGEFIVNANNLVAKGGDNLTGDFAYYNPNPMQFRPQDKKWWLINTNQEGLKFIPSGTTNKDDWQWAKAIWINPDGEVNTQGVKVKGERVLTTSDAEEKIPSRSGKDDNGIFTTYEETQEDGKLWKRSVLSSPDADGNYLVRTVTYYKDGVSYKTKIFDLKYDEDGDFVKEVPR